MTNLALINIEQSKYKDAKDYLNEDRKALEKASADLGLKVNIDDNVVVDGENSSTNTIKTQSMLTNGILKIIN